MQREKFYPAHCEFGLLTSKLIYWESTFLRKRIVGIFSLPGKSGKHHETNEMVRFPFVAFEDNEMQKALITAIREQGRVFIETRLADTENPLVFPERIEKAIKQTKPFKVSNDKPIADKGPTITKPQLNQAIASKEWHNPPKRVQMTKQRFK